MKAKPMVLHLAMLAAPLLLIALPAQAESIAELENLSRGSATPAAGLALARRQIGSGDLLEAMATLERVLIQHPQALEAQLLRAGLLCRLDDRAGSTLEFSQLRGRGVPDRVWNQAAVPCNALQNGSPAR